MFVIRAVNLGFAGLGNGINATWNLVDLVFGGFSITESLSYDPDSWAGLYGLVIAYQP